MGILYEMSTTEYEVVVQKEEQREKYSLLKVPEAGSLLVQAAVAELSGRLNPSVLYQNLVICADLFEITYNAVDGLEGVQAEVWKLRQNMNVAAIDSADKYVRSFLNRIQKVPKYYQAGVKALLMTPANQAKAEKAFQLISEEAELIAKGANQLTLLFQQLSKDAGEIVQKMIETRALDNDQKKELEKNIDALEASITGLESAREDLEQEIEELTQQYDKLDKRIDKAVNQQFWLNITSAVMTAVGNGLSAYVSSTAAGAANQIGSSFANGINSQAQSNTMKNVQSELNEINAKMKEVEKSIGEVEAAIQKKSDELAAETDEIKKAALLKEKEEMVQKLELQKTNKANLEAKSKSCKDMLTGISAGLANLGGKLDKEGNKIEDEITRLTQMADKIFETKSQLRKEKREILRKVAEYTKTVANTKVTKNSLSLAIAALSAGIGTMNYIVSVLNDFYTFWLSITAHCENIASGEIENYIALYGDDDEELKSLEFYEVLAQNAGKWTALGVVLAEYQNSFYNFSDKIRIQLSKPQEAEPEIMWKKAIEMSKEMYEVIALQIDEV